MNKMWSAVILGLGCSLSSIANANVTLEFPSEVNLLVTNMEKPNIDSGLLERTKSVTLPDGVNQIVFQYIPGFLDKNDMKKAYSEVIIAKFKAQDDTVTLKVPDYSNYHTAKTHIKKLDWTLQSNSTDQAIDKTEDVLKVTGITIGHDYIEDAVTYNRKGGKAAVLINYDYANGVSAKEGKANQSMVDSKQKLHMNKLSAMQRLYKHSSPQERKAFRKWIIDQE
ncbi:MAG: DUF2057 family protein [Vibrio sp.]